MKKCILAAIVVTTIFSALSLRLMAGDTSEPAYPVEANAQERRAMLIKHRIMNACNRISRVDIDRENQITVVYTPRRVSDGNVWIVELFQATAQILTSITKVTTPDYPNVTIQAEIRTINMDAHERSAIGLTLNYPGDKFANINWDLFSPWDSGELPQYVVFHKLGTEPALKYCQTKHAKIHSMNFCSKFMIFQPLEKTLNLATLPLSTARQ